MIYRCPVCDRYGVFWHAGRMVCVHCKAEFLVHGISHDVCYVERIDVEEPVLPVLRPLEL